MGDLTLKISLFRSFLGSHIFEIMDAAFCIFLGMIISQQILCFTGSYNFSASFSGPLASDSKVTLQVSQLELDTTIT